MVAKGGQKRGRVLDKSRTKHGSRTDTDIPLSMSCPSGDVSGAAKEAIRKLDAVAKEMEIAWDGKLLSHVQHEWREKFDKQLSFLNAAIEADDHEAMLRCAHAMRRAWFKIDAVAREEGIKPAREAIWVVPHPRGSMIAVYSSNASINDIPRDMPKFHIDELARLVPETACEVKDYFPDAEIEGVTLRDLDEDIPF